MQLPDIDFDPISPFDSETTHLQAVFAGCHVPTGLLPGVASGDDQNPVEVELVQGALGRVEMADVNWVEGPTEDSGSHQPEDRAVVVSPDAAHG